MKCVNIINTSIEGLYQLQAIAFAPVKEGKSCILADQSGSGKTLAYLAPVIQRLRQEEVDGVSISSSQSPRLIVLVPTAELASQVCDYFELCCNFSISLSASFVVTVKI